MLSAEAYSFKLKSRLAISLSWIAGYTNVVTRRRPGFLRLLLLAGIFGSFIFGAVILLL